MNAAVDLAVLPDAALVARDWTRSIDLLGAGTKSVHRKVFLGMPKGDRDWPLIVIQVVGGSPDPDVPVDLPVVQWDVYVSLEEGDAHRRCSAIASALRHQLLTLGPVAVAGGQLDGATDVVGPLPVPDDDAGLYRLMVTARLTIRAGGS